MINTKNIRSVFSTKTDIDTYDLYHALIKAISGIAF